MKLLCNPHTYSDKAATLVQEAAYLQANLTGQDADAVSIPISHIDGEPPPTLLYCVATDPD